MTQKNDNTTNDILDQKLQEAQQHADQKDEKAHQSEEKKVADRIQELETELAETQEIAKKAQYDYITLKTDFDGYRRRNEENAGSQKIDSLISVVKKFLPFVEGLRKSIETIPEEKHENPMSKGIILTYNKFIQTLETMGITPIEALGLDPDNELHEPVSMQPTQDEKLKGKIIQEFERGFVYQKDGHKKVISTSKVVIWQ